MDLPIHRVIRPEPMRKGPETIYSAIFSYGTIIMDFSAVAGAGVPGQAFNTIGCALCQYRDELNCTPADPPHSRVYRLGGREAE